MQGLAIVCDAFAQLGYRPPRPWVAAYEASLARALQSLRWVGSPVACTGHKLDVYYDIRHTMHTVHPVSYTDDEINPETVGSGAAAYAT